MSHLYSSESVVLLALILFRVSILLGLAWVAHSLVRTRNPLWKISLWRTVIVGVVIIVVACPYYRGWGPPFGPAVDLLRGRFAAMINPDLIEFRGNVDSKNTFRASPERSADTKPAVAQVARSPLKMSASNAVRPLSNVNQGNAAFSIQTALVESYLFVAGILLVQLVFQFLGLRTLIQRAEPADERLAALVGATANSTGLAKPPRVLVSSIPSGPLAAGILDPVIVLPRRLVDELSERELRFVLSHECCHFAGRDLIWAFAARLIRIVFWPHPLFWRIPAAHRFACDVRCDAMASGSDVPGYSQMMARLALSLHSQKASPVAMAFFGRSEAVSRIKLIEAGVNANRCSRFRRLLTLAGLFMGIGVVGTLGINHFQLAAVDLEQSNPIQVSVAGPNGEPIEGAEIWIQGLRCRKEPASHHGNRLNSKGTTDKNGVARLKYPKYAYEQMETGVLTVTVTHPDFVDYYHDHSVDLPIKLSLMPGRRVRITAIDEATGNKITERLFVVLPQMQKSGAWKLLDDGSHESAPLDSGLRSILVISAPEGQPPLFSDLIDLGDYPAGNCQIDHVSMSPGRMIRGRLSDNMPRPVKNGKVGLVARLAIGDDPKYENTVLWHDFAHVDDAGNFEFPSVPRAQSVEFVANSDGWVSTDPNSEEILRRFPDRKHFADPKNSFVIAQEFQSDDSEHIEIEMAPSATCEFVVIDNDGNPVPDAWVAMCPNAVPHSLLGIYHRTSVIIGLDRDGQLELYNKTWSEQTHSWAGGTSSQYVAKTDKAGLAKIENLPGKFSQSITISHQNYEIPTGGRNAFHRSASVDLTPGDTAKIELILQRKGVNILGQ